MGKVNKSDMIYDQKQLMADLIGCECFGIDENADISEYDESIEEINSLINYYIASGNKKEVYEWRKMLQQVKVDKRRAKRMIDNDSRTEAAYT